MEFGEGFIDELVNFSTKQQILYILSNEAWFNHNEYNKQDEDQSKNIKEINQIIKNVNSTISDISKDHSWGNDITKDLDPEKCKKLREQISLQVKDLDQIIKQINQEKYNIDLLTEHFQSDSDLYKKEEEYRNMIQQDIKTANNYTDDHFKKLRKAIEDFCNS